MAEVVSADDIERSPLWLEGLWRLNRAIASTGKPLYGNLCYDDLQGDYQMSPPIARTRVKRDRLRRLVAGKRRMLEVGVNGGHSAYVALAADPELEFHGVDICEHPYVEPAVEVLKKLFPGRVRLTRGHCLEVLPRLATAGLRFDMFHIDGAKHLYFKDILNSSRMIDGESAVVLVDDSQLRSVKWVWRTSVRYGLIEPDTSFLPGPPGAHDQNAAGRLCPLPSWRNYLLTHLHSNVPPMVARVRRS